MLDGAVTLATDPATNRVVELAITGILSAGVAGFFAWLFNRPKTNSDIDVNESAIIQNAYNTIAGLQKDLDSFIVQTKALRAEADAIETAKRDADRLIIKVRDDAAEEIRELKRGHADDREKWGELLLQSIMTVNAINDDLDSVPHGSSIAKREGIRLLEMLFWLRSRITGERKL